MRQTTPVFLAAAAGAMLPLGLMAGAVAFQGGPTLGGAGNAALYDFQDGTVADAAQVNSNFNVLAGAVNDNDTRITDHDARLSAVESGGSLDAGRIAALEALLDRVSCDNVSYISNRTYTTLNSQLDADYTGAGICGAGKHVCNTQEVTMYALVGNCGPSQPTWVVGGYSNTDFHRRAAWNGQDSTQCQAGNYPYWNPQWAGYDGRIHCVAGSNSYAVACCVDQ